MANNDATNVASLDNSSGDNMQQQQTKPTQEPQTAHGGVIDGDNISEEVWHAWLNVIADWSTQKAKHGDYIKVSDVVDMLVLNVITNGPYK